MGLRETVVEVVSKSSILIPKNQISLKVPSNHSSHSILVETNIQNNVGLIIGIRIGQCCKYLLEVDVYVFLLNELLLLIVSIVYTMQQK